MNFSEYNEDKDWMSDVKTIPFVTFIDKTHIS